MPLSPNTVRAQIARMQPLLSSCSLETMRKGQDKLGELMEAVHRRKVMVKEHSFSRFDGAWIIPKDVRREGVVLYLHGGGYACGTLEYAKGFGAMLADQCGVRVFCIGYRLAPEHPYPAALEDTVEAYRYLLGKGYSGRNITLCGESAGGGLCYALALQLKSMELALPAGVVAISPWTDLTNSGASYEANRERDPSLTKEVLDCYAGYYTTKPTEPLVSPLFGALQGMPPSLLFVGGDEVLLSDTQQMHKALLAAKCDSTCIVAPQRWHAYVLYGLKEDADSFLQINRFLDRVMSRARKIRWMRLDNAAKLYPAARRQNWSNVFRLSATLTEAVDTKILQDALDVTVRRFPSIAARLRKGVFWYYLEQLDRAPVISQERSYPLAGMSRKETRQCALRVIVYEKRIAVEIFHSLTDGTGAMIFLKTLLAEYLQQKYGLQIPAQQGVLGRLDQPAPEELEDSFLKYAGRVSASRRENDAFHLRGTPEESGFLHLTCLQLPVKQALAKAHSYGVSLTTFLGAAMMMALQNMQQQRVLPGFRKHIRVLIPINLRRIFPSKSLRNFALYSIPEIDPRLGQYSFEEICHVVHHRMGLDMDPKLMSSKIATNVVSEKLMAVKIMPLFVKNLVMKAVFRSVGERKSCLSMSNLGAVQVPQVMQRYIQRMDFILGVQSTAPYNCGILSWGDTLYINFIRNTRESDLEYHFYQVLRDQGLPVQVETNRP